MNTECNADAVRAARELLECAGGVPDCAVVLGSGLGQWCEKFERAVSIPYGKVYGMPVSEVKGHGNRFVFGKLGGKTVLAMQGRVHYYEGYSAAQTAYPVRIMGEMGIKHLVLTNAAGAVNESFCPGDIMLIRDHINFSGHNALRGARDGFVSMNGVYDGEMCALAHKAAARTGMALREGVYFYSVGPCYETPAEIRAIRLLGGDAVGMSTVHEATAAAQLKMKTAGLSLITNMAAGITGRELSHGEVLETGRQGAERFAALLEAMIRAL